jgi:hypothetical protein
VGCNIDLHRIAPEARIPIVSTVAKCGTGILPVSVSETDAAHGEHRPEACATLITPPEEVRAQFRRVKPLGQIKAKERGWTLDVLNIVRRLGKPEFTTAEVYAFERELEKLHPGNRHVRDNPVNKGAGQESPSLRHFKIFQEWDKFGQNRSPIVS